MKRIIVSISIVLMVGLVLSGCGGEAAPEVVVVETVEGTEEEAAIVVESAQEEVPVDVEVDFTADRQPIFSFEDGITWLFSEPSWTPGKNPFLILSESESFDLSGAANAVFWEFIAVVEAEYPDGAPENGNSVQFPVAIELAGTVNHRADTVNVEAVLSWSDSTGESRLIRQSFQGELMIFDRLFCVANPPDCDGSACHGSCPNIGLSPPGVPAECKWCLNLWGCGCGPR